MATELNLYDNIEKVENKKHEPLHVFVITSNRASVPKLKFAAANPSEINYCIENFEESLRHSNKKCLLRNESNTYCSNLTAPGYPETHRNTLPPLPTDSLIMNEGTYVLDVSENIIGNNINIRGTGENDINKSQRESFFEELKLKLNKKENDDDGFVKTGNSAVSDVKIPRESLSKMNSNGNRFKNREEDFNYNISMLGNPNEEIHDDLNRESELDKNLNQDSKFEIRENNNFRKKSGFLKLDDKKCINKSKEMYSDEVGCKLTKNVKDNNKNTEINKKDPNIILTEIVNKPEELCTNNDLNESPDVYYVPKDFSTSISYSKFIPVVFYKDKPFQNIFVPFKTGSETGISICNKTTDKSAAGSTSANSATFIEDSSVYNELYHENMDNFIFVGSSLDAYLALSKPFHLGCYLLRQDNDRQILTVQCEKRVVKFNILSNPLTKMIYISNESESFKDLSSLLSYYEQHSLPNNNAKLTIPFKLRPN